MNLSKIGQFISRRRMAMGLTQAQLAERLNVTDKAVSKWERGKSLPDVTLFSRVAAELRVSVVELLSGELMNVVRSRPHLSPYAGTILRIYWFRPTCSAAIWSTLAPVSIPAYPPRWFAIESSPGSPRLARAAP